MTTETENKNPKSYVEVSFTSAKQRPVTEADNDKVLGMPDVAYNTSKPERYRVIEMEPDTILELRAISKKGHQLIATFKPE